MKDLKYAKEKDFAKDLELTAEEAQLQRMLRTEHNTIDLINENMKLKEMINFMRSNYSTDMQEKEAELKENIQKADDLKKTLEQRDNQDKKTDANLKEAEEQLEKKNKDYDELFGLLGEREKEIE